MCLVYIIFLKKKIGSKVVYGLVFVTCFVFDEKLLGVRLWLNFVGEIKGKIIKKNIVIFN